MAAVDSSLHAFPMEVEMAVEMKAHANLPVGVTGES